MFAGVIGLLEKPGLVIWLENHVSAPAMNCTRERRHCLNIPYQCGRLLQAIQFDIQCSQWFLHPEVSWDQWDLGWLLELWPDNAKHVMSVRQSKLGGSHPWPPCESDDGGGGVKWSEGWVMDIMMSICFVVKTGKSSFWLRAGSPRIPKVERSILAFPNAVF